MVKKYVKELVKKRSPTFYSWLKTCNDKFFQGNLISLKNTAAGAYIEEMIAPLFSTEWGRKASWGALVLFSILCVAAVTHTFTHWYQDCIITRVSAVSMKQNMAEDHVAQWIAQIPEEHLFGKLGVTDGEAVPITSLQLRLVGVINSGEESSSRVIISEAGQPGKVYSVGDSLPSGITVNAITDDGVILENDGHMEKLPLQRSQLSFQGMPKPLLDSEQRDDA